MGRREVPRPHLFANNDRPSVDEEDYEGHLEARDPQVGTKIYRGHRGGEGEGSVGIHWSTSRHVAEGLSKGGGVHEATIEDPEGQVIPWGVLQSGQFAKGDTEVWRDPSNQGRSMGFAHENELRLRPGAKINIAGSDEPQTVGIGEPSYSNYTNLYKYSVPGTPQHKAAMGEAFTGPLTQMSLFDPVYHEETGEILGHIPNEHLLPGGFKERMAQRMADVEAVEKSHGLEEFSTRVGSGDSQIPAQRDSRD